MPTFDKRKAEVEKGIYTTHTVVVIELKKKEESFKASASEAKDNTGGDHIQNPSLLVPTPQIGPRYRSYVSKNPDKPAWIEEPFREHETVLLFRPDGSTEGPYTIKTAYGDGKYSLYHLERIVFESELKRPEYQKK